MVVDIVETLYNVEFCFSNLLFWVFFGIKLILLGHLVDEKLSTVCSILDVMISSVNLSIPIVSNTAVNQLIFSSLISLEILSTDLLFSIDKPILISMVIEVDFSEFVINLDEFFPVIIFLR